MTKKSKHYKHQLILPPIGRQSNREVSVEQGCTISRTDYRNCFTLIYVQYMKNLLCCFLRKVTVPVIEKSPIPTVTQGFRFCDFTRRVNDEHSGEGE